MKAIITFYLLCLVSISYAQDKQALKREGIVFGSSIGIANCIQYFPTKSQNSTDFGFDLKFGYMITPNFALLLTSNVSAYNYSGIGRDRKRDFGIVAPTIQYWFWNKLWIQAGAGLGVDAPVFFDIKNPETDKHETAYYSGWGINSAIGYEFYKAKKYVIDLKIRLGYRNVNIVEGKTTGFSTAILLGFNFH